MDRHMYYMSCVDYLNVASYIYLTSCSVDLMLSIPAWYLESRTEERLTIGDKVLMNYLKWTACEI